MLKIVKTAVVMGAAGMLLCGSAFAAQDAAGEQPFEEGSEAAALATPSQETRAQVETEADGQPPAAGEAPLEEKTEAATQGTSSQETRSEVEAEAVQSPPADGEGRK